MSDQCLFSGIVEGRVPSVRVAEDDTTYAFMDINPASDDHLLVIPKRHSQDCCGADAWQTEFHFHLHVVPRYVDKAKDRLTLPWRPEVPGERHAITALGERLAAALS